MIEAALRKRCVLFIDFEESKMEETENCDDNKLHQRSGSL